MQFFKDYVKFNESLDNAATNKLLGQIDELLKEDKPKFNKIMRKVSRIIAKSDTITDNDIKGHIKDIYNDLNSKLNAANKMSDFEKDNQYQILKNLVDALEKNNDDAIKKENEKAKEVVAQQEKEKKDKEAKEGKDGEKPAETKKDVNDADKIKQLFNGTKVSASSAPQLSKTLVKTQMPEVKAVQQFLQDRGYLQTSEAVAADGYFGDKTAAAVMAYQKDKGLTQDGIVGTNTWKAILTDVKFDVAADFKATQPATTGQTEKPDNTKIAGEGAPAGTSTFKIVNAPSTTKMTFEDILEELNNEKMNDNSAPSDEDKITETIVGQVANGVLNAKTTDDLFNKYKQSNATPSNKNGIVNGLLITFDISTETLNGLLNNVLTQKTSNPDQYQKSITYSPGTGEKIQASLIVMSLASTRSKVALDEMKSKGISTDVLEKILAPAEAKPTEAKPTETAAAKPAETKPTTETKPTQPAAEATAKVEAKPEINAPLKF